MVLSKRLSWWRMRVLWSGEIVTCSSLDAFKKFTYHWILVVLVTLVWQKAATGSLYSTTEVVLAEMRGSSTHSV